MSCVAEIDQTLFSEQALLSAMAEKIAVWLNDIRFIVRGFV